MSQFAVRKSVGSCRSWSSQALERAEIIGVAQFAAQLFENLPVARAGALAVGALKLLSQVVLKPVVIEKRVVDVEQKDRLGRGAHGDVPSLRSALSV